MIRDEKCFFSDSIKDDGSYYEGKGISGRFFGGSKDRFGC